MAKPRNTVNCAVCEGSFFPKSLPFHLKACYKKNPFVDVNCDDCGERVRAGKFEAHSVMCKAARMESMQCAEQPYDDESMQLQDEKWVRFGQEENQPPPGLMSMQESFDSPDGEDWEGGFGNSMEQFGDDLPLRQEQRRQPANQQMQPPMRQQMQQQPNRGAVQQQHYQPAAPRRQIPFDPVHRGASDSNRQQGKANPQQFKLDINKTNATSVGNPLATDGRMVVGRQGTW
jgi:hypothetical protein